MAPVPLIAPGWTRRGLLSGAAAATLLPAGARAQAAPLRIGVMSDLSGIMSDYSGTGTATSALMAIEDFGGNVNGRPVELLRGDHLNKADVGLGIARQWYDDGVAAIFDIGTTSVALGIQNLTREKSRVLVLLSTASSDFISSLASSSAASLRC